VRWLEQVMRLDPSNTAALYQLSLAYALAGNEARARESALALYRRNPAFPGLADWMQLLGVAKPPYLQRVQSDLVASMPDSGCFGRTRSAAPPS
jgi:hypothetical protein